MDKLFLQLNVCTDVIGKVTNIDSLNKFCAAFHKFASALKNYLPKHEIEGYTKIHVETIFLCFTQVITCITQLERTLSIESSLQARGKAGAGVQLLASRSHFKDRIEWCLRRLQASVYQLAEEAIASSPVKLEDLSFVELLDLALDKLETYSEVVEIDPKLEPDNNDQLVGQVNHILRHVLAFANVALESDMKALKSICETVLEECSAFEKNFPNHKPNDRKLEALSLQRALYSLETYLNEALLRLIFSSLLEVGEASVSRLKSLLKKGDSLKSVDKLISDFDINVDRIQQIGVFAIAFTHDVKTKTIIRSCLASLESLDSSIVPAFQFQATTAASFHANILEHHFNEELVVFRNVIHGIIDSRALINNYLDFLSEAMDNAEKLYANGCLARVAQMGNIIFEHFQLEMNYQELLTDKNGARFHQDFVAILRECQAVFEVDIKVDLKRITKRFKILYSVLTKLRDICEKLMIERSVLNNENSLPTSTQLKSVSIRQHSFANPAPNNSVVSCHRTKSTNTINHEGDLISFNLTEILRIS